MTTDAPRPRLWVLTGPSGAGKATAVAALERRGVACVDNLPVDMLVALAERETGSTTVAVVDARQGDAIADAVPPPGVGVLFLDAHDDVLVRRLADSTRPHPCASAGPGAAAVAAERAVLTAMRAAADVVVDTSALTEDDLAERVVAAIAPTTGDERHFRVAVSSFGFKYGGQPEADWVVDARILANPFWEPALRPLTGLDPAVRAFVLGQDTARELVDRLTDMLGWVAARAAEHGRTRLHVAVGCTGGRHRSVVLACALADRLRDTGLDVDLRHRDVERPDPR